MVETKNQDFYMFNEHLVDDREVFIEANQNIILDNVVIDDKVLCFYVTENSIPSLKLNDVLLQNSADIIVIEEKEFNMSITYKFEQLVEDGSKYERN